MPDGMPGILLKLLYIRRPLVLSFRNGRTVPPGRLVLSPKKRPAAKAAFRMKFIEDLQAE